MVYFYLWKLKPGHPNIGTGSWHQVNTRGFTRGYQFKLEKQILSNIIKTTLLLKQNSWYMECFGQRYSNGVNTQLLKEQNWFDFSRLYALWKTEPPCVAFHACTPPPEDIDIGNDQKIMIGLVRIVIRPDHKIRYRPRGLRSSVNVSYRIVSYDIIFTSQCLSEPVSHRHRLEA
jgi:hypothetical protein